MTKLNSKTLSALHDWQVSRRKTAEAKAERAKALATLAAQLPRKTADSAWLVLVAQQFTAPTYGVKVADALSKEGRPVFEGAAADAARQSFQRLIADMREAGITIKGRAPQKRTAAKSTDPMQADVARMRAKYPTAALRRRFAALMVA